MFVVSICACWILLQNDAKTHVAVVFLDIHTLSILPIRVKEIFFFCKRFTCNDKTWYYTPWKINMDHNDGGLEDHVPFQMGDL